ncbi:MAG: HD domain-containing protein [Bacteroidales bacterium]|nr:HD domain-containing protein [Bacteroidales bacterium]
MCSLLGDALVLNEHEAARWLTYDKLWSLRWLPADEGLLPLIAAQLLGVDTSLAVYLESEVIPRYAGFDKAHREDHARSVVMRALDLADHYDVSRNIVYAAAACHDLGLSAGREVHHLESGRIIRNMTELRRWFTEDEIETIAQAAEDHRASAAKEPRSIYGKIVAEADRLIEPEQIIRRTVQYGLSHYPELPREGHWQRTLGHLKEKYGDGGYLRLWIPESPNSARLEELRSVIRDQSALRKAFDQIWETETRDK